MHTMSHALLQENQKQLFKPLKKSSHHHITLRRQMQASTASISEK